MGKKKARKVAESDSDMGFDDDMEDANMSVDSDNEFDNEHELKDDETEDEDSDTDGDGSEDDDREDENGNEQNAAEMDELEKEYLQLRREEQDILRNLKHSNDEDLQKGQAVKNQRALWDKTLELRFLLQKGFSNSNRLPQEPARSLFCETDAGIDEAYSDLIDSSKKTLDSILELQQALIDNNPSISQSNDGNSSRGSKQSQSAAASLSSDIDDEWQQISQMQSRMVSYRNKSIDKWHRKTQVTTGAAAIKDKLQAFNQSISEQVATYMRDPSKMIKGMQQNKSLVAVFGNQVPKSTDDNNPDDETFLGGDPELLDDSEFYQQLLKEFFETIDLSSSEAAFYAMKRLQTKKRKVVDRRASKSRKIRYHVHEKIVSFMAPRPMNLPPMAPKLFENLFGLKSQKASAGAQA